MKRNILHATLLPAACAALLSAAMGVATAGETQVTATQSGGVLKSGQQVNQHAAQPLQGAVAGGASSELSRILDVVVTSPAPTDAYSVSLTSIDKKSSISVDVKDGSKTVMLSTTRNGAAPGNWKITAQTTRVEHDLIATAISKAFDLPGESRSMTSASSSAKTHN